MKATAEEWRERVRQFDASGLTMKDFCVREGINSHRLRWWRGRLGRGEKTPDAEERGSFVPVVLRAATAMSSPVEVVIHGIHVVRVPVGFDEATLKRVIDVLRGG